MKNTSRVAAATLASLLIPAASAQISKNCPGTDADVCYSLNIPSNTASSGSGDIFFQITASSTEHSWVGLGQGDGMAGANIFVMYQNAAGDNVTISPRLGVGHVEPEHQNGRGADLTLLAGSGIKNGVMTANVLCSDCASWSGGTMDFTSGSGSWLHAAKMGTPIKSDDLNAQIEQHDDHGVFQWDFSNAKGGSAANPFVAAAAAPASTHASSSGGGSMTTMSASGSEPSSGSMSASMSGSESSQGGSGSMTTTGSGSAASQSASGSGYVTTTSSGSGASRSGAGAMPAVIVVAHAALASLAVCFVLPLGGILVRVANFSNLVWVHASIQYLGLAMFIAAFSLGAYYAHKYGYWNNRHPIIGTVVFALMLLQPAFGILHHRGFKKVQQRNIFSWAHVSIGRIVILLGMINGGLGLILAGGSQGAKIGYGVGAGIMGVSYLAAIVYGEAKRGRKSDALGRGASSDSREIGEAKAPHRVRVE